MGHIGLISEAGFSNRRAERQPDADNAGNATEGQTGKKYNRLVRQGILHVRVFFLK